MRLTVLIALAILPILVTAGCDSSTEPEQPKLKTGANVELAIELPLVFPPDPRRAQIVTEWSVIQAGAMWFRNASDTPIDLELWTEDVRAGTNDRVGNFRLPAFTTNAMRLSDGFDTNDYRYDSWTLKYRQAYQVETIVVGFAP